MRISAKARYGLASMVHISQNHNAKEYITIISIAEKLGISKIYLEQVFSLLKRSELVISAKGAQGGYQLARMPGQITVFDVLSAIEHSLFEQTEPTVSDNAQDIEKAMQLSAFQVLDDAIKTALEQITLEDLVNEAEKHRTEDGYMFFL